VRSPMIATFFLIVLLRQKKKQTNKRYQGL